MMGNQQTTVNKLATAAVAQGVNGKGNKEDRDSTSSEQRQKVEQVMVVPEVSMSLEADDGNSERVAPMGQSTSAKLSSTPANYQTMAQAKEPSLIRSFGGAPHGSPARPMKDGVKDGVMITDALSDVRVKYHINQKEIGHGHYGVVRKCMHRETREWYAIKSIRKSKVQKLEILLREVEILKEVDHPNIIKLIEIHEDDKYLHLITELCTGGELFDRIISKTQSAEGHFSEKDAASLIRSILDAIRYCHDEKQIVHRDLKPENFLYSTPEENSPIKIIDFGLSRHDSSVGIMKTKVGTPYYVAPEVLRREYTKSCDIWSIGVITYILLCGYPPFYGDSDNQIFDQVRTGLFTFPSPDWDDISDCAKDFIRSLLRMEPSRRLTARQALAHTWITRNNNMCAKVRHESVRSTIFKKYMGTKKLKKAALMHIASKLTQAEIGCLGDLFNQLDRNGDGQLTLEELNQALCNGM